MAASLLRIKDRLGAADAEASGWGRGVLTGGQRRWSLSFDGVMLLLLIYSNHWIVLSPHYMKLNADSRSARCIRGDWPTLRPTREHFRENTSAASICLFRIIALAAPVIWPLFIDLSKLISSRCQTFQWLLSVVYKVHIRREKQQKVRWFFEIRWWFVEARKFYNLHQKKAWYKFFLERNFIPWRYRRLPNVTEGYRHADSFFWSFCLIIWCKKTHSMW